MKWGSGFKIQGWDDAWKAVLSIAIIIIIIFMLVDFISWRTALDIIKEKTPISGPAYKWIKGYGYVPLAWRGNFSYLTLRRWTSNKLDKPKDYIAFIVNDKNLVWVYLDGNYGAWNQSEKAQELGQENSWYKQSFGDYCEVYVEEKQISDTQGELLLIVFGEDRFYVRKFKTKISIGGCGGGFTSYYYP